METVPVELPAGERWRCRNCHLRDVPQWQAYNEPNSNYCHVCNLHVDTCGLCHWIPVSALPRADLRQWELSHAPEVVLALQRRWIRVSLPGRTQRSRGLP
jgi:hypothetical protein